MENIFEEIIKNKIWDRRSVCGPGSSLKYTEGIRNILPVFLKKYNIQSILDAPCGDYGWMNLVDLEGIKYIGGDIVGSMIEENQKKYPNVSFIKIDLTVDMLPSCDLLFVRDCLLHLSNSDIKKVFFNICRSDIKYVMMSNWFEDYENFKDIETGNGRFLNFLEDPYNFNSPIDSINDYIDGFPKREMCLWKIAEIKNFVKD
jgi:hypothetical protein